MRAVAFAVADEQGPEPIGQPKQTVADIPLDCRCVDVIIGGLQAVLLTWGDHICTKGRWVLSTRRQTNQHIDVSELCSHAASLPDLHTWLTFDTPRFLLQPA